MGRTIVAIAALLVIGATGVVDAGVIKYKLRYQEEVGPKGKGEFTFSDSTSPRLDFESAFSKTTTDLVFDQVLLGGGAEALFGFFEGDASSTFFPAINLASLEAGIKPVSFLLSFESAGEGLSRGVYCIRPSDVASGRCGEDESIVGLGNWSARQVPEPSTFVLLILGMLGLTWAPKTI